MANTPTSFQPIFQQPEFAFDVGPLKVNTPLYYNHTHVECLLDNT